MTSRIEELVKNSWKQIAVAVAAGLTESGEAQIGNLATMVAPTGPLHERATRVCHLPSDEGTTPGALDGGAARVVPGEVCKLFAQKCLPVHDLEPAINDTDALTRWAESVRRYELRWVLDRLLDGADPPTTPFDQSSLDTSRGRRLVAFRPTLDEGTCTNGGVDLVNLVGLDLPDGYGGSVRYPRDRLALSRLQPLELGWDFGCSVAGSADGPCITLSLVEFIKIVRMPEASQVTWYAARRSEAAAGT